MRLAIGQYVLDQGKKINDSTGPSSVGDKENKEDENETENSKAVSAKSIPTKWVDEVLQLKQLMDDYLKRAWNSDNSFEIGLEEVWYIIYTPSFVHSFFSLFNRS